MKVWFPAPCAGLVGWRWHRWQEKGAAGSSPPRAGSHARSVRAFAKSRRFRLGGILAWQGAVTLRPQCPQRLALHIHQRAPHLLQSCIRQRTVRSRVGASRGQSCQKQCYINRAAQSTEPRRCPGAVLHGLPDTHTHTASLLMLAHLLRAGCRPQRQWAAGSVGAAACRAQGRRSRRQLDGAAAGQHPAAAVSAARQTARPARHAFCAAAFRNPAVLGRRHHDLLPACGPALPPSTSSRLGAASVLLA
jgi:hypothetical protein